MYLGRVVEFGLAEDLFDAPRHPYTAALNAASPNLDVTRRASVDAVAGELPSPLAIPTSCAFHPRCPRAIERRVRESPDDWRAGEHRAACHLAAS
jgi:oligopeptide/dipeptide ABC transporter ATP-binding protein